MLCVRPDGYVGAVRRFERKRGDGQEAVRWLDGYFEGFLRDN